MINKINNKILWLSGLSEVLLILFTGVRTLLRSRLKKDFPLSEHVEIW